MSEPIFMFNADDPRMVEASAAARKSFRYFWRELCWERRRIIPGLDMAMIKLPFTDGSRSDGNPDYEQMWCNDVDFDGEFLSGTLVNAPNWLESIKAGDSVRVPLSHLSDWIMTSDNEAYGAYTVNLMRSAMGARERKAHDRAWGLYFGDPNQIRTEIDRTRKNPGFFSRLFGAKKFNQRMESRAGFHDHPMCVNMLEKIDEQLQGDPSLASFVDDRGWSVIHGEALAGNLGTIKMLLKHGADINARTPEGKDAAALARCIGWNEIAEFLSEKSRLT